MLLATPMCVSLTSMKRRAVPEGTPCREQGGPGCFSNKNQAEHLHTQTNPRPSADLRWVAKLSRSALRTTRS